MSPSPEDDSAPAVASPALEATAPRKWWQSRPAKLTVTVAIVAIALIVVARSIKPEEFAEAFKHMNPWWFLAAFAVGTLTWVGAAVTLVVFAPIKVPFREAVLTQVASSFVGAVAPGELGPLALSIRFLVKRKMETTQAAATMILMALSQFVTSFGLVILAIVFVGVHPDIKISWRVVGWVMLGIIAVASLIVAVKKTRTWTITNLQELWSRTYPEAVWALKHPRKLGLAIFGSLVQTGSFVAAFTFSLLAFGQSIDVLKVTAAYLVANTLGSMIPVPGGVGSVEATLTVGMTAIGVPAAVALSAAVTFRLATFYAQIPIGWAAFEYLQVKRLI